MAVGRIDGAVELWAWQEGTRLAAFPAHRGSVAALLFLHAGGRFLTAGEDGKVTFQRACGGCGDRVAKVGMLGSFVEDPGGVWMVGEIFCSLLKGDVLGDGDRAAEVSISKLLSGILGSVMVRISWPAQGFPGLSSSVSCTLCGSQPRR